MELYQGWETRFLPSPVVHEKTNRSMTVYLAENCVHRL